MSDCFIRSENSKRTDTELTFSNLKTRCRNSCLVDHLIPSAQQQITQEFYNGLGALTDRPWVMLSAGGGLELFHHTLAYAFRAGACGYLAGRAFWGPQAESYPDLDLLGARIREEVVPVAISLQALLAHHGTPRKRNLDSAGVVAIAQAGPNFIQDYPAQVWKQGVHAMSSPVACKEVLARVKAL